MIFVTLDMVTLRVRLNENVCNALFSALCLDIPAEVRLYHLIFGNAFANLTPATLKGTLHTWSVLHGLLCTNLIL